MSRRVLILAALCAGLGALLWLGPGPDRGAGEGSLAQPLPPVGEWQRFSVVRQGWAPVEVTRTAQGWRVGDAPLDADAARLIDEALASGVGFDQRSQAPDEVARARFGFGPHSVELRLQTAAGERRLLLGKVLDGRRTFVTDSAAGAGVVLRAKANLRRLFERPPHTWPERRLFPTRAYGDVARITRKDGPRTSWVLARDAADRPWRLDTPAGSVVGQQEALGLVNGLVALEAERFEGEQAPFKPAFTLEAQTFAGQRFGLAIARERSWLRARPLSGGPVAALPRWVTRSVDMGVADLLDRRLLQVDLAELREVVAEGARPLHLVRRDDGTWIAEDGAALDAARTDAYLRNLVGLRIGGFAPRRPDDAFAPPYQRIRLALAGDRVAEIRVGAAFGQGRFVDSSDRRDGAFVLGGAGLAGTLPQRSDLAPQAGASPAPAP